MLSVRILQVILAIGAIGLLVFIHEFGHFITAKLFKIKVLEFMFGLPGPKLFSFQRGETTYGVTAIPFGGYVKTVGSDPYEELTDEEKKRSLEHAPILKKSAVVLAGPLMNFLFAILLFTLAFKVTGLPVPVNSNKIGAVIKNNPAEKAGIKPGDRILEVDGKQTKNWSDLVKTISKKPNKTITLVIKHNSKTRTVKLKTYHVKGEGKIGIIPLTGYKPITVFESVKVSFIATWSIIYQTAVVVFNAVSGKPQVLMREGKSIIGIVSEASKFVTSIVNYLALIASLNVAIGFVNVLPIPPLDGGKIVIYIIESIKGGYLSKKALIAINAIGIALLLSVFVYFTIKDVTRIVMSVYPKM